MVFLVPGFGAQGGETEATVRAGVTSNGNGLIINSSRAIIYASDGEDFAEVARQKATAAKDEINQYREKSRDE
jgi:orotidine-5'-phosphate decarboxylase